MNRKGIALFERAWSKWVILALWLCLVVEALVQIQLRRHGQPLVVIFDARVIFALNATLGVLFWECIWNARGKNKKGQARFPLAWQESILTPGAKLVLGIGHGLIRWAFMGATMSFLMLGLSYLLQFTISAISFNRWQCVLLGALVAGYALLFECLGGLLCRWRRASQRHLRGGLLALCSVAVLLWCANGWTRGIFPQSLEIWFPQIFVTGPWTYFIPAQNTKQILESLFNRTGSMEACISILCVVMIALLILAMAQKNIRRTQ
jgi:hypothetical protein